MLAWMVTVLLTVFQIIRIIAFIQVNGGIEHDGGWMLTISRSLAEQGIYTTMVSTIADPRALGAVDVDGKFDVQDKDGRIWFFTGSGIGPASIMPDALVLRVFGTDFWALRLGPLLFYTGMLLLAARIVYELAGVGAIVLFHAFLFFYPQLSIFLGYEAMGEVPTMCYILSAYLAFAAHNETQNPRRCFVTGLMAGLAVNAKLLGLLSISGLYVFAFVAALAYRLRTPVRSMRISFGPVLSLAFGTAVPLLLWELIQLVTIVRMSSFAIYQQHLAQRWLFVLDDGSGIGLQSHSGLEFLTDKFFVLTEVAHPEHWVTALVFLVLLAGGIWFMLRWRQPLHKRTLLTVLWLGWLTNTGWFVGLAKTGWARHYWFGLVQAVLLLSVFVFALILPNLGSSRSAAAIVVPAGWRRVLMQGFGLILLALVVWGFISQPYPWNLFIPDSLVAHWQKAQIHDPYGARLPWVIIPRSAQSEIADFIKALPGDSHIFMYDGHKAAELPPLTGRIQYPLKRRPLMPPQTRDVLILGPSVLSPWLSPFNQSQGESIVQQQCKRPLVTNDFYRVCGLATQSADGATVFAPWHASFQNGIDLLGFDTYKTTYRPGESLEVSLYWQPTQPINQRYKAFVHLVGTAWNPETNNPLWGQRDQDPGDGITRTTAWIVGSIIEDSHLFRIASSAPPGHYQIEVGLYLSDTGERQHMSWKDGTDDHIILFDVVLQP
jgi:hypothetical protein